LTAAVVGCAGNLREKAREISRNQNHERMPFADQQELAGAGKMNRKYHRPYEVLVGFISSLKDVLCLKQYRI